MLTVVLCGSCAPQAKARQAKVQAKAGSTRKASTLRRAGERELLRAQANAGDHNTQLCRSVQGRVTLCVVSNVHFLCIAMVFLQASNG